MMATRNRARIPIIAGLLCGLALALSGTARIALSAPESKDSPPVNTTCPVSPDEPVDPRFTTTYKGMTVATCCRRCLTRFEADPEAYIANLSMDKAADLREEPAAGSGAQSDGHDSGAQDQHSADHIHDPGSTALSSDEHVATDHVDESSAHDHDHDHDSAAPPIIPWLGRFHPPATDIPISFLLGASLAELLFVISRRDMFRAATVFCVWIAAAGAVVAVTLGWFNGGFDLTDDDWVKATHRWLGSSTALLAVVTFTLLRFSSRASAKPSAVLVFRVTLLASAMLAVATGFFGGALVYGLRHYSW